MSIWPKVWNAKIEPTTTAKKIVGDSSGSVTRQNRGHGPAPSTSAASCSSSGIAWSPDDIRMNVSPSVCQIVMIATPMQREVRVVEDRGLRVDPEPRQQADHRVEQRAEDHRRDRDRRRDRRREDRAVDPDALELLVREHREHEAERDAGRHGQEREADRRLEAVDEVLRAEHVAVLVEADVACSAGPGTAASGRSRGRSS